MMILRDRHILYVDDTEEQRYAMRRILEGAGFHVHEAASGAEAFRQLYPGVSGVEQPEILAVILDVKLPDMSGYDVCRGIKRHPSTASVPVLQISASFADPTLRAAGLSGGADAYVAQPVHPAELLALVEALIRSRESEKTLRFQAEVSAQLTASIDFEETLRTMERVFVPHFADACSIYLKSEPPPPEQGKQSLPQRRNGANVSNATSHGAGLAGVPAHLAEFAGEVATTGSSRLIENTALIVPMKIGRRRLGTLVFELSGDRRRYTASDIVLGEDLADRSALALQNATLYTAQQTAQAALVQSEKLAAAGRLSAAMAHEINNPLESITNLIYLIDTSPGISAAVKSYSQEALSELSRLTHIARQSLGFYRELTGPTMFDLNQSLDDTLAIYWKRFAAKSIRIERDFGTDISLTAVKGEIRQVISNLLVNALEAMPIEGMLRLETRAADAGHVLLRVIDNGSGIESEAMQRIFDPFFTTREGTGTGLGLWVSDNIVRKHGGRIRVTSRTEPPASGTTFEVKLPRFPAIATKDEDQADCDPAGSGGMPVS